MTELNSRKFANYIEHNWAEVLKNFKDALVFMDDPTAESLHWNGGLTRALDSGAVAIENFSPFVVNFELNFCSTEKILVNTLHKKHTTFVRQMIYIRMESITHLYRSILLLIKFEPNYNIL